MEDFVSIRTVFNNQVDRSIEALSRFYADRQLVKKEIIKTIGDALNEKNVKGKKVLIKPNWVRHSIVETDEICLRTNDNFLFAVVEIILELGCSQITLGDAPVQGCKWDLLITKSFLKEIEELSQAFNIPIYIKDFRRRIYIVPENSPKAGIRPLSDYVIFDLGKDSILEPITDPGRSKFRVTNYDPGKMSLAHAPGIHKYCITHDLFEADIVLSVPKVKTHQKTGITCALKNLVGINGDKDFLPHHRIGGTKFGGDCYPGGSYLRFWSELMLDAANRRQGKKSFYFWQKISIILWKLSFPGPKHQLAAGWHGNDTTWRMVLDINRIAEYGRTDAKISDISERMIFSLCDGIIAGQGDGPLKPSPLPLGVISFANNSVTNDRAMATLLNLPVERIPLLNYESYSHKKDCNIILNGKIVKIEDLKYYSKQALPPIGWRDLF